MKTIKPLFRGQYLFGVALLAAFFHVSAVPSLAQGFGRNKVQYEEFKFKVYKSDHFDVHFYDEFAVPARDATTMLERWYGRLSGTLSYGFAKDPIILYANHPDFQQTNVIGGELSEGTGGVTEALRTRVVLPLTGVYRDNDHVLGHELVHVFQYDMAQSSRGGGLNNLTRLPLWTIEGLAEYLSIGNEDAHTAMWLRDALIRDDLPTITQLTKDPRYFPYRYGQGVWAYIGGRFGDDRVSELWTHAALLGNFERAIRDVVGMSSDSLSADWHDAIRAQYTDLMVGRTSPDSAGRPLIVQKEKGALNISPVISPDGKYVAFFSQRSLFSVELYVADATTGDILKTLASPSSGGHFDNLSFINSAGAWSPDSRSFAFIVFADGDNEIHILDVASRNVRTQLKLKDVGAVTGVAWAPDGRRLAVAGISGGVSDLFVVDADGSNLRKLTDDRFAALQPTWSPDGRYIAFATDGGPGANLDILATASMRIATIDVASGQTQILPGFAAAKNINPQYSPDGRSLYFISDVGGFSDLFRLELASGVVSRVTNLKTGVSGITYLSPALSVASQTGDVVFSVFQGSGTNIFSLTAAEAGGTVVALDSEPRSPGSLLPPGTPTSVSAYVDDYSTHLPRTPAYPIDDYSSRLSLDYIGNPTIGFTTSPLGTGFFGGVSLYFGDMLGNKTLGMAVEAQGNLKDSGGQIFFQDSGNRWNWAVVAGRIPYISSGSRAFDTQDGVVVEQLLRRTYYDQAAFQIQYPLSVSRRLEFSAGLTRVTYDTEILRWLEVGNGYELVQQQDTASPPGINFAQASAAYVGDNSFFGFTSPIMGSRYRIEATPTFGGINFVSGLIDARKYIFARPVTFAFRGLHYGRYGSDSEDSRLSPLYIGNNQLVRGYDVYSFAAAECTGAGDSNSCPEFSRLSGSRVAAANFEVRVPLIGSRSFGLIPLSFIPVELAAFVDAGVAWTADEAPSLRFERNTPDRVPVVSTGISSRFNLLGFAVLEVFYAKPFQRPLRNGIWGFQLAPGW